MKTINRGWLRKMVAAGRVQDFKSKSGTAYESAPGVICLHVHFNCNYTLRVLPA